MQRKYPQRSKKMAESRSKTGGVTVNGAPVLKPETKIDPEKDVVALQGKQLFYSSFVGLMFHKPAGCVTATQDRCQKTVMDYIDHPRKKDVFPVGRLDLDTEGLLFLINDGDLSHRMLSPRHHVPKTYEAQIAGEVTKEDVQAFEEGVDIGEKKKTLPAQLEILEVNAGETPTSQIRLTICEGKFHQVKRMFEAVGVTVVYLKRLSMGSLKLDETLATGDSRALTQEELECLKES